MTIASADALLETQELRRMTPRREKIAKALGTRAMGRAVKKAAGAVGTFVKEQSAIPVTVGALLMITGLAVAGGGLMDAGERISERAGDTFYAAVAPTETEVSIREVTLDDTTKPISGGGASFVLGAALAMYGVRSGRRRAGATENYWAQGLDDDLADKEKQVQWHAAAVQASAVNEEVYAGDSGLELLGLHSMLDEPYKPCLLERAEERFGKGVVSIYEMAVDVGRCLWRPIADARAQIAKTRAEAAAASRYDGFATVSTVIEYAGIGIPDYTA